ncbi:MAG: hypothetical protein Q9167_006567 [Letrouitia subvulpina]
MQAFIVICAFLASGIFSFPLKIRQSFGDFSTDDPFATSSASTWTNPFGNSFSGWTILPAGSTSGFRTFPSGTDTGLTTFPSGTDTGLTTFPSGTDSGVITLPSGTSNGDSATGSTSPVPVRTFDIDDGADGTRGGAASVRNTTLPEGGFNGGTTDFENPTSGGVPLIDTVNKWRKAYGLVQLQWDARCSQNAKKTGADSNGLPSNQTHEIIPPTTSQVISPGQSIRNGDYTQTPFELSYIGWLCEHPGGPLVQGGVDLCALQDRWLPLNPPPPPEDPEGHFKILTGVDISAGLRFIGCAFTPSAEEGDKIYQGQWVCDLY